MKNNKINMKGYLGKQEMQAIERTAMEDLSNYENDYENDFNPEYYGGDNFDESFDESYENDYDGSGDDFLDFSGDAKTFKDEMDYARTLNFTVTNDTDVDEHFLFNPGFKNYKQDDTPIDGVAKHGDFLGMHGNKLNCIGSECTIDQLRKFCENNPMRVVGMKIMTGGQNATQQIDTMFIETKQLSIFGDLGTEKIQPSLHRHENTFQNNILTVPRKFDLNDQISIKMSIKAKCTCTITLLVGSTINSAKALKNKVEKAGKSERERLKRAGIRPRRNGANIRSNRWG